MPYYTFDVLEIWHRAASVEADSASDALNKIDMQTEDVEWDYAEYLCPYDGPAETYELIREYPDEEM